MLLKLLSVFVLTAMPSHEFYTSWMTLTYNQSNKSFEAQWRTDTWHFEEALSKYMQADMTISADSITSYESVIELYLNDKMSLSLNSKRKSLKIKNIEVDLNEMVVTFHRIKCRRKLKSWAMTNTTMLATFPKQQNMVQVNYKGNQMSKLFVLDHTSHIEKIK